jgi:nucleoside phosphorylase
MKVLIIEDDDAKYNNIEGHLLEKGVSVSDVVRAKNMSDFAGSLSSEEVGLFIIDFKVPSFDNGTAIANGKAILEAIVKAGKDDALLLAISSYPDDFSELRAEFEARGCILADYKNVTGWKSTLNHLLVQLKKNIRMDFLIFCALHAERKPYIVLVDGKPVNRGGVSCWDFEIEGKKGSIVLLPQMGLVNAAILAATCIDRYKPKLVGMSGICGGFSKHAELGQLLVSKMAYEYQSGKWSTDGFQNEPYQVQTEPSFVTLIQQILDDENLIVELESGHRGSRPMKPSNPKLGFFTSGSAVIADKTYLDQIEKTHRKVSGLDMEVFAVQRAAELSVSKPVCLCAKAVVDLCDDDKNDDIHDYGSYVSAKFLLKAIKSYFKSEHETC